MKNKNIKNAQPQGHHDDCEDCRREKKQNQALISIYERLQAVENHSKIMKKSLQKHKKQFEATTNKFKQLDRKFNSLPKETRADVQFKNLGYQLAFSMVQQCKNGEAIKQNQRLKCAIINLHKPRKIETKKSQISKNRSLSVSVDGHEKVEDAKHAFATKKSLFANYNKQPKNMRETQRIKQLAQQSQQTKTTGFFSNEPSTIQRYGKTQNLSLWLYQQNNISLQEELYENKTPHRLIRRKNTVQKGAVLPAIKLIRNQQ